MKDNRSADAETPAFDPAETVRIGHDVDALDRFYRAHYDEVVRYFARRLTDPHDVADLVADTFLAAVESSRSFDHRRGRTVAWLIGIAHNKLRHFQRERHNHSRAVRRITGRRLLDADDIAELEERIDTESRAARALGLLDRLTPAQRELIELVDLRGLTPAETAKVVGISAGLARIRLHRARSVLRSALESEEFENREDTT